MAPKIKQDSNVKVLCILTPKSRKEGEEEKKKEKEKKRRKNQIFSPGLVVETYNPDPRYPGGSGRLIASSKSILVKPHLKTKGPKRAQCKSLVFYMQGPS